MTKLRVALAMGGGVSLGAFSGAALTEALKILTLFGRDKNNQPFEKVVVDVFSGASAGSMSLLIMLRYLVDSPATKEEIQQYFTGDKSKVNARVKKAIQDLDKATNDRATQLFQQNDHSRLRDVVALEILQQFQEEIWTQDVKLSELLNEIPFDQRGGLLDRKALETVAKKHMEGLFDSTKIAKLRSEAEPPVLAQRVAFASTLTCLTPVVYDGRKAFNVAKLLMPAVSDGLTSLGHRDQRVFDINFTRIPPETTEEIKNINDARFRELPLQKKEDKLTGDLSVHVLDYPLRWVRAHSDDKVPNVAYDLYSPEFWAKLTTTSLASGAFPGAFDPVPIKRYWWEYGLKYWPTPLRKKSAAEAEFLFVDGGTLDNEPIRQAFRMASFFDSISVSKATNEPPDFERVVLFVDPTISHSPEDLSLRLDLWAAGSVEKNRLFEVAKCLVGVLMDESTVLEANKVDGTLNLFQERELLKQFLMSKDCIIAGRNDLEPLRELNDHLVSLLARSAVTDMMPSSPAGVLGEVKRILWELHSDDIPRIKGIVKSYKNLTSNNLACEPDEFIGLARALLLVAADRLMDLEGKSRNSHLIAIAPMDPETQERFMMPAGKYFGFGGLMSREAAEHAARVGRHSAAKTLWYFAGLNSSSGSSRLPVTLKLDEDRVISSTDHDLVELSTGKVETEIANAKEEIRNHVRNILGQLTESSVVNTFLQWKLTDKIVSQLESDPIRMPIKIPLRPEDKYSFWKKPGRWFYEKEPNRSNDYLTTWIAKDPKTNQWTGPHISGNKVQLFGDTLSWLGYPQLRKEIDLPSPLALEAFEKSAEEMAYPALVFHLENDSWELKEWTSNAFEHSFRDRFLSVLQGGR